MAQFPKGAEKGRFSLTYWLNQAIKRITLPGGGEVPLAVPPQKLRGAGLGAIPLMNSSEFESFMNESSIPENLRLLLDCRNCGGSGVDGHGVDVKVCKRCSGFGREISPLGLEILRFFQWIDNPVKIMTEEMVEKKRRISELEWAHKMTLRKKYDEAVMRLEQKKRDEVGSAEQEFLKEFGEAQKAADDGLKADVAALDQGETRE